jgi:hypothetical protein
MSVNRTAGSPYMKWFNREVDRIYNGMTREEDGEWIPGELYFYLNYMPMSQTRVVYTRLGGSYGEKVVDLPEVWEGVYLRFHYMHQARYGGKYNPKGGLHGAEVSSRGKSKSFSLSALLARQFLFGESSRNRENVKALVVAPDDTTLVKDGVLNKFLDTLEFLGCTTEFPSRRLKDSLTDMHWISGYRDGNKNAKGSKNEVIGVPLGNDPNKTRGKRSSLMLFDELGKERNFSRWWTISRANVQEGALAFGFSHSVGTGGTEGSSFEGALDILNSPRSNFLYAVPNYWDKGSNGGSSTVFFFPSYMNYKPFYNKDGVSNVVEALLYELNVRHTIKYTSYDPVKLTQQRAEFAFTIQEAIMRRDSTIFPVADLVDRINYIDTHPSVRSSLHAGSLSLVQGEVSFVPDALLKPVWHYPHKDNKVKGCVLISAMPVTDRQGHVPSDRYIAGFDPVDVDNAETLSLCACHVLDMYTDNIVASYVGREQFVDDSFEIARRLLLFYNATCNYENNKNGFYKYMSQHGNLYLLCDNLEFLQGRDDTRVRMGNARKGTPMSAPTREYAIMCIRDYLLKPVRVDEEDTGDDDQERAVTIKRLDTIPFRSLLQELSMWTRELNCDEVSSLIMLFLLREERLRLLGEGTFDERSRERDLKDYLGNDHFFEKNYPGAVVDRNTEILRQLGYIK